MTPRKPSGTHSYILNVRSLIATELHQLKWKWICLGICKPRLKVIMNLSRLSVTFLINTCISMTIYSLQKTTFTMDRPHLQNLMQPFDWTTLINTPICYYSHNSIMHTPFLTNLKARFQFCKYFEAGLFDHPKLILTVSNNFQRSTTKKNN